MPITDELDQLINELKQFCKNEHKTLHALKTAAEEVGKSWGSSWIGYQSRIYYKDFVPVPPGARFSSAWGSMDRISNESRGTWCEYDFDDVISFIHQSAKVDSIAKEEEECLKIEKKLKEAKIKVKSILSITSRKNNDDILKEHLQKLEKIKIFSANDFISCLIPKQIMTHDVVALGQGVHTPPHIAVSAQVMHLLGHYSSLEEFIDILQQITAHIQRNQENIVVSSTTGDRIFIGHGNSLQWLKLKDFVAKLGLTHEEFNRVPVAGVTNVARLEEMLNNAKFAFLVMTAEDEQKDGSLQARMNVIHEVGLFQGRLGFSHAIVILEDGCKEFTNIQGLGQIRFSKGDISTCFEQIRETLRYHGITED